MARDKLTKKLLKAKQVEEDRKFKKILRNGIIISVIVLVLINVFYIHWCDTRYFFRKQFLYGKELSPDLVCETENVLKHHKTNKVRVDNKTFWICSSECKHHIVKHNQQHAYAVDALTGDSICKAGAVIGLKEKGEPVIAYFKNKLTMNKYYEQKNK
jgi:hypothetical protein